MDSNETFFWPTTEIPNGSESDNGILSSPMEGFIQAQGRSQQIISQQQSEGSPASSPLILPVSSSEALYSQSNPNDHSGDVKSKNVQSPVPNSPDEMLPIEIVNPDAIEPKPRSYTCRICQVTFPNKSAVTVHSRIHTDHQGKPYRCSFCQKGFSTNFYLKQHERIHSGQKPYKCPMCPMSFKQLSHVQQHVRTHTGVRPYKCHWPGCGKAFLQQSHLKSHEARHIPKTNTGVKPFKCHWPDCGKCFAQLSNLKSHVARHTPGKLKSRKSSAKKLPAPVQEDNNAVFNLGNVINQAAAAADIVPGNLNEEAEAEIRPFLCPGCSKLYVREATFKKHLEECKAKLQQSISATASALGITPPPMPSSNNSGLNDFDAASMLIPNLSPTDSTSSMKKSRSFSRDLDENVASSPVSGKLEMHNEASSSSSSSSSFIPVTSMPSSVGSMLIKQERSLIKQERMNEANSFKERSESFKERPTSMLEKNSGFKERGRNSSGGAVEASSFINPARTMDDVVNYKLPQQQQQHVDIIDSHSLPHSLYNTSPQSSEPQLHDVLSSYHHVRSENKQVHPSDIHQQQQQQRPRLSNSIRSTEQLLMTSSETDVISSSMQQSGVSHVNMSSSKSHAPIFSPPNSSIMSLNREQAALEPSTINQSAIKWQWDQPVPRLNYN